MRETWFAHLETTRRRPVLLVDEAQEMAPAALSELRLLEEKTRNGLKLLRLPPSNSSHRQTKSSSSSLGMKTKVRGEWQRFDK